MRASARPHPVDPTNLVLVPERAEKEFRAEGKALEQAPREALSAMGYPRLPEDEEVDAAEGELERAAGAGDWQHVAILADSVREWKSRAEAAHRAVIAWAHRDATKLEEDYAHELASPLVHAFPLVGIPPEAEHAPAGQGRVEHRSSPGHA